MSFKAKAQLIGTGDTVIYECPAGYEAAGKVMIGNKSAGAVEVTIKFYDSSLDATETVLVKSIPAKDGWLYPMPPSFEQGDKLIAAAASSNALTFSHDIYLAEIAPSALGFTVTGPYDADTTYARNEVASDAGSSYVSRVDGNVGNTPASSPAEWMLLAGKGETGAAGEDGTDGADGTGTGDMLAATYDPNSHATDAFNVDNHTDGTTYKRYSATEKTKLNGIEAAADVTDAGNVGAAIHGASAKSSLVDADEVAGTDSASSFALIRTTWTNVKAFLKTYFDTLYATVSHTHAFSALTSKPTTLSGYGITDALPLSGGTLIGTLTLAADPSSAMHAATKQYADGLFASNDAMLYKGAIDASTNPNYPAADAGHTYRISVAGKIGGASGINVEVGDIIVCNTDSTPSGNQATVGTKWNIIQTNIDGAVVGPSSSVTDANPVVFDGTTGKLIKQIAYSAFKTALSLVKGDVGLGNVDNTSDATKNSSTATLTNKRITKRVHSQTSTSTLTPDSDSYDVEKLTAQAAALTVASPSGTPTDKQILWIEIKDNGTARAISWNSVFRAIGVTLPTTTVVSKLLEVGCAWNAVDSKWDVLYVGQQA